MMSLRNISTLSKNLKLFWRLRTPALSATSRSIHVDRPPVVPTLTTSYAHGTSSVSLLHATVSEVLLQTVERVPDREALIFLKDGVRKTFAQFQEDVDQAAASLLAIGLKKGDRLAMWGPNVYEWVLFQFATAKAGIILVSINPAYQVREVEYTLKKVGCSAIVCLTQFVTQKYCGMLREICPELDSCAPGALKSKRLPELHSVIVLDSQQPGMYNFDDFMQAGDNKYKRELQDIQKKLSFNDPVNIQFTSGTTGAAKGATLSHHNIVNNSYFSGLRLGYHWQPHPKICLPVPMFHCFGSVGGGMNMAVHGTTIVSPLPGYNSKANLAAIESERCTVIYGTPTMYVDMINQPDINKYDLSSVEIGVMSGSPCPQDLIKKVMSVMGVEGFVIGYGTTENSPVTFIGSPHDNLERKSGTVGYILEHTEATVVNTVTGQVVPLGELGEVRIRGFSVMLGYWGDEEKTAECITKERWYKTGDLGRLDAYSYLRIEGRIKDMIIRGGENIYPAEIEQFLHTHPKVKEAQVIGVKDERMGEEVCACIKLIDGEECTPEEIKAFCKNKISHFKIPSYIIFVTSYPLTSSGKILKNKLRETVEEQLGLK